MLSPYSILSLSAKQNPKISQLPTMNFFKSVFLEDHEASDSEETLINDSAEMKDPAQEEDGDVENDNQDEEELEESADAGSAWSFGGLMKTLATRSETVIQTYKRDLEEFGSGLKKETAVIREVASRAVKDLPGSLEVGASVAQESLESVGQAIDDFGHTVWKGTAEIITQGKESILAIDLDNSNNSSINNGELMSNDAFISSGVNSKKYSRYKMQLRAIQCDENTYIEEPDDVEEYEHWKNEFVVDENGEEIMTLMGENEVMEGVYKKIVPSMVDHERFWSRYFYKVYKLQQAEDARVKLVKRAISGDDEEEDLSWDIEDDEEEVVENVGTVAKDVVGEKEKNVVEDVEVSDREKKSDVEGTKKDDGVGEIVNSEMKSDFPEVNTSNTVEKFCEEKGGDGKADQGDSCKDSDVSIVSTQPSLPEEEDLGWDEIEDIGSDDDRKTAASASGNLPKADLHKRLSAAEEEEDLSWDIEEDDDDEPIKTVKS